MSHDPRTAGLSLNALPSPQLWDLISGDSDRGIAEEAARHLGHRTGPHITDQALSWLTDPSVRRRRGAVWVLSTTDDTDRPLRWSDRDTLVPVLLAAADVETDDDVVVALAATLGFYRAAAAVPWMIGVLTGTRPSWVREGVCCSLGGFAASVAAAATALEAALEDPAPEVRDWASFAFAGENGASTATLAASLLRHADGDTPAVRGQVMLALARRGDPRVVPHLAAALLDPPDDDHELLEEAAHLLPARQLLPGLRHYRTVHPGPNPALDALIAGLG